MEKYVWLFPIIFIFHDMEEIIGISIWLKRNTRYLEDKHPFIHRKISKMYHDISAEGFAVAVYEEFLLCIVICIQALLFDNQNSWSLWLGSMIACTLHFVIHIVQTIVLKKYIPAVATSVLALPISIWVILKSVQLLKLTAWDIVLWSVIGLVLVIANLKFAQWLNSKFVKWQKTEVSQ